MSRALAPTYKQSLGSAAKYFQKTDDPVVAPFIDYLKEIAEKISYKVDGIKMDGKVTIVTVKCRYIDGA